jgi:hypothetical protein
VLSVFTTVVVVLVESFFDVSDFNESVLTVVVADESVVDFEVLLLQAANDTDNAKAKAPNLIEFFIGVVLN